VLLAALASVGACDRGAEPSAKSPGKAKADAPAKFDAAPAPAPVPTPLPED